MIERAAIGQELAGDEFLTALLQGGLRHLYWRDLDLSVVGIAVKESDASAEAVLKKAGANFTNMLDADGDAFAQVGSEKLPRTYLLDPQGKILWFDLEYSLATRRELKDALQVVAGEAVAASEK